MLLPCLGKKTCQEISQKTAHHIPDERIVFVIAMLSVKCHISHGDTFSLYGYALRPTLDGRNSCIIYSEDSSLTGT